MNLNRGDVYWVNLDPTVGAEIKKRRPCVLIGVTPVNEARRTVLVLPLSTAGKPHPPLAIEVKCLGRKAIAVCDQIRAVDKNRLINNTGSLSSKDMKTIVDGLRQILSI